MSLADCAASQAAKAVGRRPAQSKPPTLVRHSQAMGSSKAMLVVVCKAMSVVV